jgi:protocatechuate 3,4-dioxygenase alpha subunit
VGPFFYFGLCVRPAADLASPHSPDAIRVEGRVLDGAGDAVFDAMVEIWQADAEGRYRDDWGWARCGTDADGRFGFTTIKPGPVEGPNGAPQAPHIETMVYARGLLKPVLTRIYFPDEGEANASDPVLGLVDEAARPTLVAESENGSYVFDVRLQGDDQTVFFAV